MVSSTIIAGIIGALASLVTGLIIAGLWIWRHTTSLEIEEHDRIEELENNQRSQFAAELADLYTDIEDRIENDDSVPDEMGHEEQVVNIIHREVDKEDVDSIIEELEKIGDSWKLYNQHVEEYNSAWENCGYGAASTLGLLIFFVGAVVSSVDPFTGWPIAIYSTLGIFTLAYGKEAFDSFKEANNLKSELDKQWQEYKRAD